MAEVTSGENLTVLILDEMEADVLHFVLEHAISVIEEQRNQPMSDVSLGQIQVEATVNDLYNALGGDR
jgi:hypothetical protein